MQYELSRGVLEELCKYLAKDTLVPVFLRVHSATTERQVLVRENMQKWATEITHVKLQLGHSISQKLLPLSLLPEIFMNCAKCNSHSVIPFLVTVLIPDQMPWSLRFVQTAVGPIFIDGVRIARNPFILMLSLVGIHSLVRRNDA